MNALYISVLGEKKHQFSLARRSNYSPIRTNTPHKCSPPKTMLFTRSLKPCCYCMRVGSEPLLLSANGDPCQAGRQRRPHPMAEQLFMRRERETTAGGEDGLPKWTSIILTSFVLYCDVMHEQTPTGSQACSDGKP